jgi:DNA-binding GntR family transcriptional regulator
MADRPALLASAAAPAVRTRVTVAGLAEDELRAMVLDGRLVPGERLNEVFIAETLGISRGPLREAIQRLASEGLLSVVPHKGAYVRSLSEAELRQLYELRIAIETYAVRLGAERGTPVQRAALQETLERTRQVLDSGEDVPYPSDLDVHVQMVALAHNPALLQVMREAHAGIHLARARSARDPGRARAAYEEHEQIVGCIVAGESVRAAELLERHLESSLVSALERLRRSRG